MLKTLVYLSIMIVASVGISWLSSAPGDVAIDWHGYKIETSAAFLLTCVVLAGALIAFVISFIRYILNAPRKVKRYREHMHHIRGLQAVTQSLAALASGDISEAKKLNLRTRKYLKEAPVVYLLDAQLARLEQNEHGVHEALEKMLKHRDTRALAARSLAEYNARKGNLLEAEKFASEASGLDPKHPKAYKTLFQVSLETGQWQQAQQVIDKAVWTRVFNRYTAKRWRALFAYARAHYFITQGDIEAALFAAERAWKTQPSFAPFTVQYAELLMKRNEYTRATEVFAASWKHNPHPLITECIMKYAKERPASSTVKLAKRLYAKKPHAAESAILLARAYMQANEWTEARTTLKALEPLDTNARALNAMAELEELGYEDKEVAAHHRVIAAQLNNQERWICTECGHQAEQWSISCPACKTLDSLSWKAPPEDMQYKMI